MKFLNVIIFLVWNVVFWACTSTESTEEQLIGTWQMGQVIDGGQNVTKEHNPANDRWIKFNRNGSFESGGGSYGYNDGIWELDSEKMVLFLDSKVEGDDSEWNITFQDNKTIWTGIGTPRQQGFKLIHYKVSE
jgi:hypothetical protein